MEGMSEGRLSDCGANGGKRPFSESLNQSVSVLFYVCSQQGVCGETQNKTLTV